MTTIQDFYNYLVENYDDDRFEYNPDTNPNKSNPELNPSHVFVRSEWTGKVIQGDVCMRQFASIESIEEDQETASFEKDMYKEINNALDFNTGYNTSGISKIVHEYTKSYYVVELSTEYQIIRKVEVNQLPTNCLADIIIPICVVPFSRIELSVRIEGERSILAKYKTKDTLVRNIDKYIIGGNHTINTDKFICAGGVLVLHPPQE